MTLKNAFQPQNNGGDDFVVAKFYPNDSWAFCSYLVGSGREDMETHNLAIDSSGNLIVAGTTLSRDFPTTNGAFQRNLADRPNPKADAFITKISADGSRVIASTYYGGEDRDEAEGVEIDKDGGIVISGGTNSLELPVTSDAYQGKIAGDRDFYIAKLNSSLTSLQSSSYFGGSKKDTSRAMTLSPSGDVIAVGHTQSNNFPLVNPIDRNKTGYEAAAFIRISSARDNVTTTTVLTPVPAPASTSTSTPTTLPPTTQALTTVPTNSKCIDSDGDGWGWDGKSSCRIDSSDPNVKTGLGDCIDSDGDGWGWDGKSSCRIDSSDQNVGKVVSECVDTDGDGWGWNGRNSCKMK